MLHLARAYEYLILLDVAAMHADLSHASGRKQARTYHPIGISTKVLLRSVLAGEAHNEHFAEYGRLRTEHRGTHSFGHLFAYSGEFLADYLSGKIYVGAPIKLYPYNGETIGGLRADTTHTGTAIDGGLNRECHKLFHFLSCHATSFGHYDYGRGVEVREHVDIGLAGGV